jgi:KipI family sensor histidine kinase inhibitor
MTMPRLLPCGDAALTVEFGQRIDPALNARVLALDPLAAGLPGVTEVVPTYRSLLVHYDPGVTSFAALGAALAALCEGLPDEPSGAGRAWRVPVVYGGAFGIDLEDVAARHGLTPGEVVERHAGPEYRVYMIGFAPGYAYLGGLDPTLATPRRESPRMRTPAGTIAIGGVQASVASIEAPSGWHLLGRTPVRAFMPGRDPTFVLRPGDRVRFEPVPASAWDGLDRRAAAGEIVAEALP